MSPAKRAPAPAPAPPARITLNVPADLFHDVEHWAADAAEQLAVPRVTVQQSMRAMLRACTTDTAAMAAALAVVRKGEDRP